MKKTLGIYIHIPFCASKCGYCDFNSVAGRDGLMPRYQNALLRHIEEASERLTPYLTDTVYFGGGTPSYYGAKRLREILNTIKRCSRLLKSSEITVEMNPDSVRPRELAALKKEGVNRISLGVQSMDDHLLKIIGRRHSSKQITKAVEAIRSEGFNNLSVDLIYGLPEQTKNDWAETLSRAIDLRPEHISCYGLKLEKGTPMYENYYGSPVLPDDDEQADMYLFAVSALESYGYRQYEISNFSYEGYESRHNLKYWNLSDYIGFGAGSHSFAGGVRYSCVSDVDAYVDGIGKGRTVLDEYERISGLGLGAEYIMLGLRRSSGISRDEYRRVYRAGFGAIERLLAGYKKKGWAEEEDGRWRLTPSGMLISNILTGELLDAQSKNKLAGNPWVAETPEHTAC